MLKLSMTYEIITPESAEETGFVFEMAECTARELADYIRRVGFTSPSCSHGVPSWLTCYGDMDPETGEVENRSLHPGRDKQSQRVWRQVLTICGLVK